MKKKYVYVGDINSINIEIICKSHNSLKNKINYILLGNYKEISNYIKKISSKLKLNEITDPIKFDKYKQNCLNIFNIENISNKKYLNLLNQIKICNFLSNQTKIDLVTMPINKSIFKKRIEFNGMTEHLSKINKTGTLMLMHGEKFSIIPYTTHINIKDVNKFLNKRLLENFFKKIFFLIKNKNQKLKFNKIKFLCYNPHCGENDTLGLQDKLILDLIKKYKFIMGPYPADSAFLNIEKKTLYLSTYHDQALIPFKILNKKSFNYTLGLKYRRLSPAHGTASDVIFKGLANNGSYLQCMFF